jgi:hypothetical protein
MTTPRSRRPDQHGREPGGPEAVESYLAEIAAQLPGPARARSAILAELGSGLLDATAAYQSAGQPPSGAVLAAIGEFGTPGQVAEGFRPELAARQARRVSVSLVAAGPLVGLLWITAALVSRLGLRLAPPWPSPALAPGLDAGLRGAVVVITAAAIAALAGIAATGRLTRWLPIAPRRAPTAAMLAGLGAAVADLAMLALCAAEVALAPEKLAPLPVALAAAASLARLTLATRAARRLLACRAALA